MVRDAQYEGLEYGQVVKTMGTQIAVPYRHSYTEYGKQTVSPYSSRFAEKEVEGKVCIKLSQVGAETPEWYINTNKHRQSGLVCYLDTQCEGYAILSVRIRTLATRSVYADPVEYIEVAEPLMLTMADIGREAHDVLDWLLFDSFLDDGQAIWHNKTEGSIRQ